MPPPLPTENIVITGSLAQGATFANFVNSVIGNINTIVLPLLFALALAAFVWGILKYFFIEAGSEEGRRQGKSFVIWGILGMVLLFSVWGVVNILLDTFGLNNP